MKNANEMNQNLRVNKANFYMKGFALEFALKQRRKETRKSPALRGPDKRAVGEILDLSAANQGARFLRIINNPLWAIHDDVALGVISILAS